MLHWKYPLSDREGRLLSFQRRIDLNLELEEGDFVIFYSDGVIEATNEAQEMYQTERLLEVLRLSHSNLSAQEMVDLVIEDVHTFSGNLEMKNRLIIFRQILNNFEHTFYRA